MCGACSSDARGPETAKLKVPWSGGRLGGRSSTEDGQVVAVMGTREVLVAGTAEVPRKETPKALVAGTAKVPTRVRRIPEAVDTEIPEARPCDQAGVLVVGCMPMLEL